MLRSVLSASATCLALVGLTSTYAMADGFKRIETEADFRKLIVNKKLTLGENHVVIRKNGNLKGNFNDEDLKGAWQWRDGFWCRTLSTHSKDTDCQTVEVMGNQMRGTRQRGKGKSFIYTIN